MTWWRRFLRRRQLEDQLEKELRFHLDQDVAGRVERGDSAEEARRQARLSLGGPEQVKEACRDVRGTRWLEELWQDTRYALRTLRHKPGFAAVALLTLALGTGATTVMFTVINSVLLKPLPYFQPETLLNLQEQTDWSTQWGSLWAFAYPNYLDCNHDNRSLELAAWRYAGGTLSAPGDSEYVDGREVSAGLFHVLGITLSQGRVFSPDEDRPGGAPVAIISHGIWQRRFGGNPQAIGMPLVLDGKSYTVIGVISPAFRLMDDEVDVFTPLGQNTGAFMQNREAHPGLRVWARLVPGATLAEAQTELAVVGRRLAAEYPKSNKGRTFVAEPLQADVTQVRSTLWLLLGAVGLVLLIACANIGSLMLARGVLRDRELAMRVALGAGRGRLARQCLTESAVVALAGGALGVLLAVLGIHPFVTLWPGGLPRAAEIQLDWHVLLFALAVSLACGFIFGLAPALRVPTRDLDIPLRAGARSIAAGSRRLHGAFVAAEIALAVVLLASAGMLGRTLLRLSSLDPGIDIRNVLTARAALSPATLASPPHIRAAWEELLDRARRVPGVEAVSMIDTIPMREGSNPIGYWTTPALPPEDKQPVVLAHCVTPAYLDVMRIPLRSGRFLNQQDRKDTQSVVVVDEVMARQSFGDEEPLGKHLWIGMGSDPVTVVGVVRHVRYWGPAGDDHARVRAQLYYPFTQVPDQYLRRWSELMSVAVRAGVPPLSVVEPLRHEIRGAGGDQVLYEIRTMEQLAKAAIARHRFLMLLFGVFAGLALLLACLGVYGVLAYLTSCRVPEIGLRIALGATARQIMRLVLRQSLGMILLGMIAGLSATLVAARLLISTVEGMQPADPKTFVIAILVLAAAALFASYLPARRASRLDPTQALRQE